MCHDCSVPVRSGFAGQGRAGAVQNLSLQVLLPPVGVRWVLPSFSRPGWGVPAAALELQEGMEGRKILLLLENDRYPHAVTACERVKAAILVKMFNFP